MYEEVDIDFVRTCLRFQRLRRKSERRTGFAGRSHDVKVRDFKAIGFHKQSKEKRDEIAAIYEQYGVPLPDEYKE